jgi:hypothetical protein
MLRLLFLYGRDVIPASSFRRGRDAGFNDIRERSSELCLILYIRLAILVIRAKHIAQTQIAHLVRKSFQAALALA